MGTSTRRYPAQDRFDHDDRCLDFNNCSDYAPYSTLRLIGDRMFLSDPIFPFLLLAAAILAGGSAYILRQGKGMPAGEVVYTDSGSRFTLPKPLYSSKYKLVGKPDYIVRERSGHLTPVEYKSSASPMRPYESHVLQLAAYCLLVQENYGVRPQYGLIRYRDKTFRVAYTLDLEEELLDIVDEMRKDLRSEHVARSHEEWHLCHGCGFRDECDESLV